MTKQEIQNRIERGAQMKHTFKKGKDDFCIITPIENGLLHEPITLEEAMLFRRLEGKLV